MQTSEVLEAALYAGRIMLESGAEAHRVEDTISRICKSCGVDSIENIVTVTGMYATVKSGTETITLVKRITNRNINLTKIQQVNQFSRDFVNGNFDLLEARLMLDKINAIKSYPSALLIFAAGVASALFSLMFSADYISAAFAFIVGILVQTLVLAMRKLKFPDFIVNLTGGMLIGVISLVLRIVFDAGNFDKVIIGSIMPLVPGVTMTNAIRDTLHGDFISGTVKGVDAVLTAVAIATGVGIVIGLRLVYGGGLL